MKKISTSALKWLSAIVIFLCVFNALHSIIQCLGFMTSPNDYQVTWIDEIKPLQVAILVGRMLGGVLFSVLMIVFTFNSLKSLKNGILFPMCNVGVLYGSAASYFLYRFCHSNIGIASGIDRNILLESDDLMVPLIIIIFALIYKLAVKISMENSLTI